jgi:uncharacterized membrane protein
MLVDQKGVPGNNGLNNQINALGDVVGSAENTTVDPDCQAQQKYETRPVIWRNSGFMSSPHPTPIGTASASGINDNGQVVGWSGGCAAYDPLAQLYIVPVHPLLWEADGAPHELNLPAGSSPGG